MTMLFGQMQVRNMDAFVIKRVAWYNLIVAENNEYQFERD